MFMKFIASAAMAASLFIAGQAVAMPLFTVDVSDPSAVVITGTGAPSLATDTEQAYFGVTLLDFLTGSVGHEWGSSGNSSTLTGPGSPAALNGIYYPNDDGFDDLNLYSDLAGTHWISLTLGLPAFTGVLTADLSDAAGLLPAFGTTGNVILGDYGGNPLGRPIVGTYSVLAPVPLPAGGVLLITALGVLALRRRARR